MVLDEYRPIAEKYMKPIAKLFKNFEPNTLSIFAFIFAILSGIAFYRSSPQYDFFNLNLQSNYFLLFGSFFIFLNAVFDAMDGAVARYYNKTSVRGDLLDHTLDRYADFFILFGITLTTYCNDIIGFLAIIGVLLASYMGTQAQAVGCGRIYRGILGRADRIVILFFIPIIQFFLFYFGIETILYNFTLLEIMMIYFAIAGNLTATHRFYLSWRDIKGKT